MSLNMVLLDGVVKSLALKYDNQGRPELRFTLEQADVGSDGKIHAKWWPCCAAGQTALRLTEKLEDGQHLIVTKGELCYRKRQTKVGEHTRVEVLVWSADVLAPSPEEKTAPSYATARTSDGEIVAPGGSQEVTPGKKGKPRYPKWKPSHLSSEN